jgi:hypothetical protein
VRGKARLIGRLGRSLCRRSGALGVGAGVVVKVGRGGGVGVLIIGRREKGMVGWLGLMWIV